jgi:hypothetical protein
MARTMHCKKCGNNLHVEPTYGESSWGWCSGCDPELRDLPDDAPETFPAKNTAQPGGPRTKVPVRKVAL